MPKSYRDCSSPARSWSNSCPGVYNRKGTGTNDSAQPGEIHGRYAFQNKPWDEEVFDRNEKLLEVKGEPITLYVRKIKGEERELELLRWIEYDEFFHNLRDPYLAAVLWCTDDEAINHPDEQTILLYKDGVPLNKISHREHLITCQNSFYVERTQDNHRPNDPCECTLVDKIHYALTVPISTVNGNMLEPIDLKELLRRQDNRYFVDHIQKIRRQGTYKAYLIFISPDIDITQHTITAKFINRCPCVAGDKQQGNLSVCEICYGTTFVGGYDRYISPKREDGNILASFPQGEWDVPSEEAGLKYQLELSNCWTLDIPRIHDRDVFIRHDNFGNELHRYQITNRTDSRGKNGLLLHQTFSCVLLDPYRIEYKLNSDALSIINFSPKEEMRKLNIRCPSPNALPAETPVTTCLNLRKLKAVKQPERDYLKE